MLAGLFSVGDFAFVDMDRFPFGRVPLISSSSVTDVFFLLKIIVSLLL